MTVIAFLFEKHSNTVVVSGLLLASPLAENFIALRLTMQGLDVLVDFVDGIRTIKLR